MLRKLRTFFREDIWSHDLASKSRRRIFAIRQARIYLLAFKRFFEDRAAVRAAALTYFTLLSIVPIFAIAFAIAKNFGFEERLKDFIWNNMQGQEAIINEVINLVDRFLGNTSGGAIAGIGGIILFWSVIQVLNNIEASFNDIWQIRKARSPMRKFSDYLAMMIVGPFAIGISGSVLVWIQAATGGMERLKPLVGLLLKLVPFISIWLLFTFVYIVMPNTRVKFKYGLIAGVFAGTLAMIFQFFYQELQIGVFRFGTFYGSIAVLPLFLIWLQITWLIVFMGAEISFAYQNIENYEFEEDALKLSLNNKRILTLLITYHVVKSFEEGGEPWSSDRLSHELGIPVRLVNELLYDLVNAGILTELAADNSKARAYHPSTDINRITVDFIYTRLERIGGDQLYVHESDNLNRISKIHEHLLHSIRESPSNVLLKDI
ncbi:MAG: YihY/virulence factor BrkB family protein [Bacteroidetes bacterium]|nr:MAG: YihY/virulence factor BrkB family protein [Bacteroidota bacterium]